MTKISNRNNRILIFSQFFSAIFFTIPIWIPYYQGYISIEQISFLVAMQYAIQLFCELPTGALADLIGRKWSVILGYLAVALSNLFVILHPSFEFIFVGAVLAGLSEALISGSLEALVYDSCKQDGEEATYGKVMAKSSFWYQIALAIGTLSGGFLYRLHPTLPFTAHTVVTIIAMLLSFYFLEPKIDSEHFTLRNYLRQMKQGAREAFKSRAVALMSLYYVAVAGITWTNQMYFNSFMMVELGFSDELRSVIGAVFRILNVFILANLLRNEKIFTPRRSIFFFPIMMLICYLPGLWFSGWGALPLVAGALMVGTARWIILTPLTNELFESKYRATAISALSMFIGVIYVVITLASGPVIARFGGVRMVYTLLGVMTLFTVVPLSLVVGKRRE